MWDVLAQGAGDAEVVVDIADSCAELGPLCDQLLSWTGNETLSATLAWVLGTPLKVAIIVLVALLLNRFTRRQIRSLMDRLGSATADSSSRLMSERGQQRAKERATTIGELLRSLSTGLIFGVALVMILGTLGISILPIIASAGILGLAVGFGAQSVVEDFLRGIFMLAEDQFGVGDRVDVGAVNGFVERVTLRTTVIKDPNGTVWHIPNSEISHVANETQGVSRAVVEVPITYGADIGVAMSALGDAARVACHHPNWVGHIHTEPEVRGVQTLTYDDVTIRVQVWVDAPQRRQFERHLRRALKEGLDQAGVPHPNTGYDVWLNGGAAA